MSAILWAFTASMAAIVALVCVVAARRRNANAHSFSALARAARMNYSPIDRFDLSRRLQHSPRWTAGLTIRDVIYGAARTERRFVLTAERRATVDDSPRRWVIACVEPLDHSGLQEVAEPLEARDQEAVAKAYAIAVSALVDRR